MADFESDLNRYLQGEVILAKPAGQVTRIMKRVRRNPALSGAVGVALVAVLALLLSIPWYILKITMEAPENTKLQIYYHTSEKPHYSKRRSVSRDLNKGVNSIYFKLQGELLKKSLRIDPGNVVGIYKLKEIVIREVELPTEPDFSG